MKQVFHLLCVGGPYHGEWWLAHGGMFLRLPLVVCNERGTSYQLTYANYRRVAIKAASGRKWDVLIAENTATDDALADWCGVQLDHPPAPGFVQHAPAVPDPWNCRCQMPQEEFARAYEYGRQTREAMPSESVDEAYQREVEYFQRTQGRRT